MLCVNTGAATSERKARRWSNDAVAVTTLVRNEQVSYKYISVVVGVGEKIMIIYVELYNICWSQATHS